MPLEESSSGHQYQCWLFAFTFSFPFLFCFECPYSYTSHRDHSDNLLNMWIISISMKSVEKQHTGTNISNAAKVVPFSAEQPREFQRVKLRGLGNYWKQV